MNMMPRSIKYLLIFAIFFSYSATAVDYYWDTTNPPGNVQWTEGTAVGGSDTLNINDPLSTTQNLDNAGIIEINNATTFSANNDIVGAGVINTNTGTLVFNAASVNNGNSINNDAGGSLIIPSLTAVTSGDISNSGDFSLEGEITSGTITNNLSGTIDFGSTVTFNSNLTNDGNLVFDEPLFIVGTFSNNNSAIVSNAFGAVTLRNEADGTLEFQNGASTNNQIVNEGTFNITGASSSTQRVDSFGMMNVDAAFTGGGPSLHSEGTLNLNANGFIGTTVYNEVTGVLNCNGGSLGSLENSAFLDVIEPLSITNGGIINQGDINLQNDITTSNNTITNYAGNHIYVSGNRSLIDTSLVSNGNIIFTITSDTVYDSLSVSSDVDITDCTVEITSTYSGPAGSSFEWDILSSDTSLITSVGTVINIPTSTAFEIWSQEIVANTILRLSYVNNNTPTPPAPGFTALPGVDAEIAGVLAAMDANVTNSGQSELLAAVDAVTTQNQYNYLLNNLQPDTSNSSSNTTLAMQNIGFNKIEVRVAGSTRKNTAPKRGKRKNTKKARGKTKNFSGIASGNLTPNTAMWMAGFGSLSKQQARGDNQGYRAKILGGMLGIDTRNKNDDVYGIAIGISNANVYNLENTTFNTRILGYNLMLYGAQKFKKDFFAEEIFSGVINKNHGVRVFSVDSIDLSTESSYRGALGGVRFNFGKNFKLNETFNLAQVNTLQYVLVHQPSYNETGSVAALHVSTKDNQSILTVGSGFRLGINNNDPWLNGNRELRAMVTYDAMSPDQATTANFVVGSNSFIMTSSPARWALKLGADYSFLIAKRLSLGISYDYEARSGYYDNFGEIKLRYAF